MTILLSTFIINFTENNVYSFSKDSNIKEWRIVNDGVMGGLSNSKLVLTDSGFGKYTGHVSLENNGGFASIQLNTAANLSNKKFINLRIKGDGKQYEFRIKSKLTQMQSYVHQFKTSGEWEHIKLDIAKFYPQFRGQVLDIPNFNFNTIAQISFLIANKEEEDFELLIDAIGLE